MTIERPMFPPVDRARRRFLTVAVAASVVGIPTSAAPATDPVFKLIETHRKAHAAHMASLKLQSRFERKYGIGRGGWISERPCHDEDDAFCALITAPAITLDGLFAKLAYLQDLGSEFETEWMVNERACPSVLAESFAASLKNIGVLL
jgi:hypothetical protein